MGDTRWAAHCNHASGNNGPQYLQVVRRSQTPSVLKLELAGFNDELDKVCKRNKSIKDDSNVFGR